LLMEKTAALLEFSDPEGLGEWRQKKTMGQKFCAVWNAGTSKTLKHCAVERLPLVKSDRPGHRDRLGKKTTRKEETNQTTTTMRRDIIRKQLAASRSKGPSPDQERWQARKQPSTARPSFGHEVGGGGRRGKKINEEKSWLIQ